MPGFVVAPDAVGHGRRGRGEGDASERGPAGLRPAAAEALRKRVRLVEVAGDRRRGQQPLDGEVVRLAEEGQLAPLLRVATGGNEIAGGQEDHRCHVQGVRVLPRHLDVVGPWREQVEAAPDGGDGGVHLAADEVHGGQLVERVALQAGVADPMGQLHGAFGQVGVRRVALVVHGGDGEHGRLDLGITAGQHPGLPQQRPLLARRQQLGHDARCVRDHLGRGRELDGGAAGVTGPACRLGRGAVEPDRLVARMTAPRHGRAEVQGLGSLGRVGGQRSRLLVPLLGFTQLSPGVGELRQPHGELVCLGMPRLSAGRPAQRGSQVVGHLVEPLGGSAGGPQPGRGLQAPVQMSGSYVVLLAVPVHQLGAVLPDRLEHPVAGAGRSVVHHHEVVLGQAREGVRDRGRS